MPNSIGLQKCKREEFATKGKGVKIVRCWNRNGGGGLVGLEECTGMERGYTQIYGFNGGEIW